jgi:DNA repair exonuclease SbcCD ATPase subunit
MADVESKRSSIIQEILRLESSTNDALRSSRDEIERLEIIANQKKEEADDLEKQLNALLESRTKKKKRISALRPKRLQRLTISTAGDAAEMMFRRDKYADSARRGDSGSTIGTPYDDDRSCTFTVATFDRDDMEIACLLNSCRSVDGDEDASVHGGCTVASGVSRHGSVILNKEVLTQKQNLLIKKREQLEQYQQRYNLNAKKLQQMQQHLSSIRREQNSRCDEHNSTIDTLSETKANLISRIRWRENRIAEEEKNLADLKRRLAESKRAKATQAQEVSSNINDDAYKEFAKLTSECADMLTEFSLSMFKMIESTITLPSHSSISYSIGDLSDTSTADTKNKQMHDKAKSSSSCSEEDKIDIDEQQQLDDLQQSEEQYDSNIRMVQNEIKSFYAAYQEESNANKLLLNDLEKQIVSLNEQLTKGGNEIKRLVGEVEFLTEREQELL